MCSTLLLLLELLSKLSDGWATLWILSSALQEFIFYSFQMIALHCHQTIHSEELKLFFQMKRLKEIVNTQTQISLTISCKNELHDFLVSLTCFTSGAMYQYNK